MTESRLVLARRRTCHCANLTTPGLIGSGAWIRTMIQGFKVPCPAFRRRRKSGRENSKPGRFRPPALGIRTSVGRAAHLRSLATPIDLEYSLPPLALVECSLESRRRRMPSSRSKVRACRPSGFRCVPGARHAQRRAADSCARV